MTAGEPSLQVVERAGVPREPEPSARRLVLLAALLLGGMLRRRPRPGAGTAGSTGPHARGRCGPRGRGGQCAEVGRCGHWSRRIASRVRIPLVPAIRQRPVRERPWVVALAITSPHAGDGRSTVARAISLCLAMRGERITLVDGDLRMEAGRARSQWTGPATPTSCRACRPSTSASPRRARTTGGDAMRRRRHSPTPSCCSASPKPHRPLAAVTTRGRKAVLDLPPAGEDEGAFELACAAGASCWLPATARHPSCRPRGTCRAHEVARRAHRGRGDPRRAAGTAAPVCRPIGARHAAHRSPAPRPTVPLAE